jgi:putative membrane protein
MANSLRDQITSNVSNGMKMLEVCTSDTHSTSGKRTRQGYFALGDTGSADSIVRSFKEVATKASERAREFCTFEFSKARTQVRVMGKKQFEDYSDALDNSMKVTKIFLCITTATYIAMLVAS